MSRVNPRHTLLLMRHAKSGYPPGVADHDRPLAPRGLREAGLAGDWVRAEVGAVDAVLCSTAARARETLAQTGIDAPVRYVGRLYGADPQTMVDEIADAAEDIGVLLVVGHEPTMSAVAIGLADTGTADIGTLESMSEKFPTSAIAVLDVDGPWTELGPGGARLTCFQIPR